MVNTTFLWQARSVFRNVAKLVNKMQYRWDNLISSHLGKESILSYLLQASGPLAFCCAFLLLLCIIFTLRYRSRKGRGAAILSLLTGIGSACMAQMWASLWSDYGSLEFIPIGFVAIVLLIMLIILIRTSSAKRAEKRQARAAQREARAEQLKAECEERNARRAEQREAMKETADKLSGQAKEGINLLNTMIKKTLADGNQTIEYTVATETPATSLEFSSVYVANPERDAHAAQKIRGLHALLQEGVITEEEYANKAAQLLERL